MPQSKKKGKQPSTSLALVLGGGSQKGFLNTFVRQTATKLASKVLPKKIAGAVVSFLLPPNSRQKQNEAKSTFSQDGAGNTLIHLAILNETLETGTNRLTPEEWKTLLKIPNNEGQTPLLLAVVQAGKKKDTLEEEVGYSKLRWLPVDFLLKKMTDRQDILDILNVHDNQGKSVFDYVLEADYRTFQEVFGYYLYASPNSLELLQLADGTPFLHKAIELVKPDHIKMLWIEGKSHEQLSDLLRQKAANGDLPFHLAINRPYAGDGFEYTLDSILTFINHQSLMDEMILAENGNHKTSFELILDLYNQAPDFSDDENDADEEDEGYVKPSEEEIKANHINFINDILKHIIQHIKQQSTLNNLEEKLQTSTVEETLKDGIVELITERRAALDNQAKTERKTKAAAPNLPENEISVVENPSIDSPGPSSSYADYLNPGDEGYEPKTLSKIPQGVSDLMNLQSNKLPALANHPNSHFAQTSKKQNKEIACNIVKGLGVALLFTTLPVLCGIIGLAVGGLPGMVIGFTGAVAYNITASKIAKEAGRCASPSAPLNVLK